MNEIALELEKKFEYLSLATSLSRNVCNTIEHPNVDEEFTNAVELAISEACTNAIKHSVKTKKHKKIILSFQIFKDKLVALVKEQGNGFDINSVSMPEANSLSTGGYGVGIIRKKMCKVEYKQEGEWNVLSMTKYFERKKRKSKHRLIKILIVEDDSAIRTMITCCLAKQGFEVFGAQNGFEALEMLRTSDIHFVVTDWRMPVMDGLALCKEIRSADFPRYIYIILLTAYNEKEDIVKGMEAGADDYMVKPISLEELKARVNAGKRILTLEQSLVEKDETVRKDLEAAAELQKTFLSNTYPVLSGIELGSHFVPSTYLSGDIYNVFLLDERHIGLYHIDVMGHGVRSALFSFTINQRLSHDLTSNGLLKVSIESTPYYKLRLPLEVVSLLNEKGMYQEHGSYFTMLYAILDIETGELSMYRAGHNYPLFVHSDGESEYLKQGGAPIGLGIPANTEGIQSVQLCRGDSFFVFSDGISDCASAEQPDTAYGLERVQQFLSINRSLNLNETFEKLIEDVKNFQGKSEFDDDVSILGIRWKKQ